MKKEKMTSEDLKLCHKMLGTEKCVECKEIGGSSRLHWGQIDKAGLRMRVNVDIAAGKMSARELEDEHDLPFNAAYEYIEKFHKCLSSNEIIYQNLYIAVGEVVCKKCKEKFGNKLFSFSPLLPCVHDEAIAESLKTFSIARTKELHHISLATVYNKINKKHPKKMN